MAGLPIFNVFRKGKRYKDRRTCEDDRDYKNLYRFERQNVEWLANHFLGQWTETRGGKLTPTQQMQVFLRYMADPGFQMGVGEEIGVDQTTVCKTVRQVCTKINEKAHLWIKFPTTASEVQQAIADWRKKYSIPCVIGALDCTHVRIAKPRENGDEYINRKRYPSINVQATCNAKEQFTSVSACWPGSVHDSRIWRNSAECAIMKTSKGILLSDSGYGIAPWLLVPYKDPSTPVENHFNQVYAKERVVIERCFGQVKRRFPILQYKIRVKLDMVASTIVSCFVLHNVSKYLNDDDVFEEESESDDDEDDDADPDESDARIRSLGQRKRKEIAEILFRNRVY